MLKIDETCITSLSRDELGTWTGEASYCDTDVHCSWDAADDEERADERRYAVLNTLDNLRVVATNQWVGEGRSIDLTDGDLILAVRAADRIGDDDVDGILAHAWSRGLLMTKPLMGDEDEATDPGFLARARAT